MCRLHRKFRHHPGSIVQYINEPVERLIQGHSRDDQWDSLRRTHIDRKRPFNIDRQGLIDHCHMAAVLAIQQTHKIETLSLSVWTAHCQAYEGGSARNSFCLNGHGILRWRFSRLSEL
ncbi:hypothetical protein E143388_08373 [Rhodococcus opacus]|nr:hypothetical protein E143388_08373 [Rhodococcus opacus]